MSFAQAQIGVLAPNDSSWQYYPNPDSLLFIEAISKIPLPKRTPPPTANIPIAAGAPDDIVDYQATDSIRFLIPKQLVKLNGNGQVDYTNASLEAEAIDINWHRNEISAYGVPDSTGRAQGTPIFSEEGQRFYAETMRYNFKTKRAIIEGVVTQEGEGYIHGKRIKHTPEQEQYITHGSYTTCNLKEPHFHFRSRRVKLLRDRSIALGPFHMRVGETPLPIGFLFGFFPKPRKRASGIIVPRFGEERNRGFFLQNGGYYFAINDYMDLRLTADVYSKGSYGMHGSWRYLKRYGFAGGMSFRYTFSRFRTQNSNTTSRDYWLNWNHAPKSLRNSRFSASVAIGTSTYNSNNFIDIRQNTQTEFSSNISYSINFPRTPFSLSTSLRHRQNIQRKEIDLTLPELSWNMRRIYPLQRAIKNARSPLRKLGLSHTMLLRNEISNRLPNSNNPLPLTRENIPLLLKNARNGIQHQIPIAMPINLFRYFVLTPSFNYTELWYTQELRHSYDEVNNRIQIDTLRRFSRTGYFSVASSLSTRIYGTLVFGKNKRIQAIRHLLIPSFSFSYAPDFSRSPFRVHQTIHTPEGPRHVSRYDGFIFGTTPRGPTGSLSFNLSNQLEMKVRTKADSTGQSQSQKINILENFSISGNYNFLADSFQLSNIAFAARTSLFKNNVSISTGFTLDPYAYKLQENGQWRRNRRYAWQEKQGIGTITNANISLNLRLQGKRTTPEQQPTRPPTKDEEALLQHARNNPQLYVDFNIPWQFNLNYNLNYQRQGRGKANIIQTLTFGGSLSITQKTHLTINSGFDFQQKKLTQTSIGFVRDLHCWEIVGSWVPFGRFTNYNVTLRAKASLFQDLKISKRRNFFDSFFSNF